MLWQEVAKDVRDRVPGATTAAVRVADRAARLDGLDEPARYSVTPSESELHRFVADVLAAQGRVELEEPDIFDIEIDN